MKNISTFIFDCFGVVCQPALYGWYNDYSKKNNFTDDKLPGMLRDFDLGSVSEEDMADYFLKYKNINSTREKIRDEIDSYLKIDQYLVDIIKKLRQGGYKTALLSNANNSFFERKVYTTYPEFKSLFDEMVISSLVNMVKPDPEIYLYTLKKIKSSPEESLFIDDNKPNVDRAISLGINGFVYTDSASFADHIKDIGIQLGA